MYIIKVHTLGLKPLNGLWQLEALFVKGSVNTRIRKASWVAFSFDHV